MSPKERSRPWIMRTYAGHSSAAASNALFRRNLAKGQTGLSVAFDLPTQTGYDSDHKLSQGEVGKVGVPICHLGDMRRLFDGIPLEEMNTSMTINATAPWLLGLYLVIAEERGIAWKGLRGTTQNDLLKEYLSRGTHIFAPKPALRLSADLITFAVEEIPKWNPINICSYHLQEAGATPGQELAYALANAITILDEVEGRPEVSRSQFESVVARISFFVNAGIRFVDELSKMRAFVQLWDEITKERYGIENPKARRFRYGVQVNSLGLTEQQPENNIIRIVLEMLAVTLSKDARARAVQLPAWNEALGLPRPWDQQWSLRAQQILAFETDLLEHADIFEGSKVIEARVHELAEEARAEIARVDALGGAASVIDSGYIKAALVRENATRLRAIQNGEQTVVGVNRFTGGEPSPLGSGENAIEVVDEAAANDQIERLHAWRASRDAGEVAAALAALRSAAEGSNNIMEATIVAARAGVTTGEWTDALRDVFGEYRAPTGIGAVQTSAQGSELQRLRNRVGHLRQALGGSPRILVGKPGLDGHSNGAEQIALFARDAGFEVVYPGIRLTPEQIVRTALQEGVHLLGLSILSGSHRSLVQEVLDLRSREGLDDVPVVVGGIIPDEDATALREAGVAAVFTPKDFQLAQVMDRLIELLESRKAAPLPSDEHTHPG
ncbi:MAG: protein meaA [Myxococcota bacterium]